MAPLISTSNVTLSYPLYACDFDPLDASRLVVGGGGGGSKTGVKNKITLLDTSDPAEIKEFGELDYNLEDSALCLAIGPHKGNATLVFAGVSSDISELKQGKNHHLRIFGIEAPGAGKGKGKGKSPKKAAAATEKPTTVKISEISRLQLFSEVDSNMYQRVIRLSKPYANQPQLGAVTTGLAKDSELVLFNTSAPSTPLWSITTKKETVDVDFIQIGDDEYLLAYCNDHDIYVKKVSSKSAKEEPKCVYVTPFSDSFEKPTVPKFAALRWLTKDLILMLTNISNNGGVVLQILRLPPSVIGQGHCRIVQSHRLSTSIKKAGILAVANLTPPAGPTATQGYTQFVIAVAGGDKSISLFKADLQVEVSVSLITKIKPFRTFKTDHASAIAVTDINFSNFTPPTAPITASTPPQHLKLASTGSHTIVVHTFPLFPVPLSVARGQSTTPRYVVALPSKAATRAVTSITTILGAILLAIFVQGVLEIRGARPPWLNATNYVPTLMQEAFGKPYVFPSNYNMAVPPTLSDMYAKLREGGSGEVIVKDTPDGKVGVDIVQHRDESQKTWDELSSEQREGWKKKLSEAGHWAEGMGETVLKGIVFGELGGQMGQAVGG